MRTLAMMLLPIAALCWSMPLVAGAQLLSWPDLTGRAHPKPDATIAYGTDPLQTGDLWLPQGRKRPPVVVVIHGGCWQTDIADKSLMDWIAANLRKEGIAVWNIEYRGVDRAGGGYPGTFTDVGKAIDQLPVLAKEYDLDTSRVIAVGHSAGGHLALWAAARPKLPVGSALHVAHPQPIDHVISLGGLPDLRATAATPSNGCGTAVVAKLIGSGRADPYTDTSVPDLLPLGVTQALVNGREDRIIPYHLATDYVAQATRAGDIATLHTVAATGHVELVTPESAAWAETKRLIAMELAR